MSGEDITPTNMNIDTDHDVSITASVAAAAAAAAAGVDNNDDDDVGNNEDDTTSELENRNGENNRNNENDDDDGDNGSDDAGYDTDQTSTSHFEPSDSKVNSVPFFDVFCKRLEKLWNNKRQKRAFKRWKEDQRLEYIIPRNMIDSLQGQTIYPHLRLLLPDQDSSRQFNLRETKIAQMYCNAVGLAKGTKNYDSLMCFTDPQKVRPDIAGDLSQVVQDVMKLRIPSDLHSKITLGKMNELLDELANLRAAARAGDNARAGGMTGRAHHNHEWRSGRESQAGPRQTKKSDSTLRAEWLSRVMDKWKLSPLEHKWLVRILLRKMDIGLGCATILKWYSPYATELWNAHNNLKRLCTILADPTYALRRKQLEELHQQQLQEQLRGKESVWEPQLQPAVLGNTLSPMISVRSSFQKLMTQTQANHQEYLNKHYHPSTKLHRPLALQFPALSAEIKLDGERMVVHVQDGKVTMNTRNSKWYSELYSPSLGPCLRRALHKYPNLNVILDGEIESWDNINQCLVPFGENRTVAGYRRAYLDRHGGINPLDENLHDPNDLTAMRVATVSVRDKTTSIEEQVVRGARFWLKFMAFDILFIQGPDARRLLDDCGLENVEAGSIIGLPLMERKKVLYRILTQQPNEVEICPSVVIRCNGDVVPAEQYFSTTAPMMEYGYPVTLLDSTQAAIRGQIPNLEEVDLKRQQGRTPGQISKMRAQAMDNFYTKVVDEHKFEGLVVKDLASSYLFGTRKFWWKFKPDYELGEAIDLDVVILGATFATGIRNGGEPSGYLVGVVDNTDPSCFMTLCNVNAGSIGSDKTEAIWKHTGFKKGGDGQPMELGMWFREENWGLPPFISTRSLQRNSTEDRNGWTFNKSKTYPNIWIEPEDSVVLTINGQELVVSEEHSVGLAVRFPKIKKVRLDTVDGDEKQAWECDSDASVWRIFDETRQKRLENGSIIGSHGEDSGVSSRGCRFLTPEEYGQKSKKRGRKTVQSPSRKVPKVDVIESNALAGLTFNVLEGIYSLDSDSSEAQEARDQGWFLEGEGVKSEEDVIRFIKKHGGTYKASKLTGDPDEYIIGGCKNDAKVMTQIRAIENVKSIVSPSTKRDKELIMMTQSIAGILKWTFVYSLVYRFQQKGQSGSIKLTRPELLVPGPQHYLARVHVDSSFANEVFALKRSLSTYEMERALVEGGQETFDDHLTLIPWQCLGTHHIPRNERWVLSSEFTAFWPYRSSNEGPSDENDEKIIVLYPDIFSTGFGLRSWDDATNEALSGIQSKRWDDVLENSDSDILLSVLPLAKAMGALVTPHLHSGVTHVLCDLIRDVSSCSIECATSTIFRDPIKGQQLLDFLLGAIPRNLNVQLVTPNWIRRKAHIV